MPIIKPAQLSRSLLAQKKNYTNKTRRSNNSDIKGRVIQMNQAHEDKNPKPYKTLIS
jgi:hypothetical protein